MRFSRGCAGLWAAGLLLSGTLALAAGADIQVTGAWVRWLPAGLPAAGYFTLVNNGTADAALLSVSSADYAEVGMHVTQDEQGVSRMRPVDSIVLTAHHPVKFEEGGYHLMLMQPTRPLGPGDTVVLVLHLNGGRTLPVRFEIRGPAGGPGGAH